MYKRIIAAVLSITLMISVVPMRVFASQIDLSSIAKTTAEAQGSETKTADTKLQYDIRWDEECPYGTFAFGEAGATINEGATDGKDSLLIPVYRVGGDSGAATAVIRYSPLYLSA